MQKLWQIQLNWNEELPENLSAEGQSYLSKLPVLNKLNIP